LDLGEPEPPVPDATAHTCHPQDGGLPFVRLANRIATIAFTTKDSSTAGAADRWIVADAIPRPNHRWLAKAIVRAKRSRGADMRYIRVRARIGTG
jgi:hypothetical protein